MHPSYKRTKSSKNTAKSSKNTANQNKKQSSRSPSPQASAPMQRTPNAPNGPNRRTRVAEAIDSSAPLSVEAFAWIVHRVGSDWCTLATIFRLEEECDWAEMEGLSFPVASSSSSSKIISWLLTTTTGLLSLPFLLSGVPSIVFLADSLILDQAIWSSRLSVFHLVLGINARCLGSAPGFL